MSSRAVAACVQVMTNGPDNAKRNAAGMLHNLSSTFEYCAALVAAVPVDSIRRAEDNQHYFPAS